MLRRGFAGYLLNDMTQGKEQQAITNDQRERMSQTGFAAEAYAVLLDCSRKRVAVVLFKRAGVGQIKIEVRWRA